MVAFTFFVILKLLNNTSLFLFYILILATLSFEKFPAFLLRHIFHGGKVKKLKKFNKKHPYRMNDDIYYILKMSLFSIFEPSHFNNSISPGSTADESIVYKLSVLLLYVHQLKTSFFQDLERCKMYSISYIYLLHSNFPTADFFLMQGYGPLIRKTPSTIYVNTDHLLLNAVCAATRKHVATRRERKFIYAKNIYILKLRKQ